MSDTKGIIADVKSGKGALGALLYDPATADNLKVTVANIRGVSDKIAKGEGTLGKLLADDSLYRDAQSTLKKADRALEGLGDQGPITAVGVVANSAPPASMASASPYWISRVAMPMLCAAVVQADTSAMFGPFRPW